jgi:MoxR-like ATPase
MADSIIILGPQGCGKTLNAAALAAAFGLPRWIEADECEELPRFGHLILAHELTPDRAQGLRVVEFKDAIKKVAKPHPATPAPKQGGTLRGFGFTLSAASTRRWYVGADGVKRWADNDQPA